jgi:hypothetical protein
MDRRDQEAYEFTMSFISASERYRDQFIGKWQEILSNFMVDVDDIGNHLGVGAADPFKNSRSSRVYRPNRNSVRLKDPETHKLVMTYASKLVRSLLGDPKREYVQAQPSGYEDAIKAETATRLLRYAFGLPGVFRTLVETFVDMILFGTAVAEASWKYEERKMLVRSVESEMGVETSTSMRLPMPVYDDVTLTPVDVGSFYPDPSRYRIQDMMGAAKQFTMSAIEARRLAASGLYDAAEVERAIALGTTGGKPPKANFRVGIDQPEPQSVSGFGYMIGYEYTGEVPYVKDPDRERVTILNTRVVARVPYDDYYLPFHAFTINPVQGRFYGISPAEVVRSDQSFADAIKILLAEAIIRQVHPPIAYDSDSEFDVAKLREWKADLPIAVRGGPASIGTLRYDANVQNGFAMLSGLKQSIQEASGALGGIQGEEGPDREAATVGAQRIQMALDRPELAGMLIESDPLPCLASSFLRLYQRYLIDTQDLAKRVGEIPEPFWIGDIMGDFDISFFGSRQVASRQQKLQAWQTMTSLASAVPNFMVQIPWDQLARQLVGDVLDLPDVAAKMMDPAVMAQNTQLAMMLGQGSSNGNGAATTAQPPGMLPAQAAGGIG